MATLIGLCAFFCLSVCFFESPLLQPIRLQLRITGEDRGSALAKIGADADRIIERFRGARVRRADAERSVRPTLLRRIMHRSNTLMKKIPTATRRPI